MANHNQHTSPDVPKSGRVFSLSRSGKRKSPIYILPNAITATSLFLGFLAIKLCIEGRFFPEAEPKFVLACYAILGAAMCDGIDGSVARLTRTQSSFGVHFDSLCDLVSFGIAPALLAYHFSLYDLGKMGFAGVFLFAACGALRLARFGVLSEAGKASGNFTGIPIPIAGACVATFVMLHSEMSELVKENATDNVSAFAAWFTSPTVTQNIFLVTVVLLGLGMISTFEYLSHKTIRLPRKYPFRVMSLLMVSTVFLLTWQFVWTLAALLFTYALHGPLLWLIYKRDRGDEEEELFSPEQDFEEEEEKK